MSISSLKISYYCTGHGLGHATRVLEVCRCLIARGHEVTINTGAPLAFFSKQLSHPLLHLRKLLLDSGAFQQDAFTVDMQKSLEEYARVAEDGREAKLQAEADWLKGESIDLVVSDVVPLACAAAELAKVPAVCVSNFSWDFVYSEYLSTVGSRFRPVIWQIAEDYSKADMLLRLPGYTPMPAFKEVVDVPLVVRKAKKTRSQVRAELGLSDDVKLVVFMYGGHTPGAWHLHAQTLPQGWHCIVCSNGKLPEGIQLPPSFLHADQDAYTPDLINAADCVLGKIGYGAVSECMAHHKPFVFVRRDFFNEEPFLRKQLEIHGMAVEIKRRDFLQGNWQAFLNHALTLKPHYSEPTNGAEVVAELLEEVAVDNKPGPKMQRQKSNLALQRSATLTGSTRLRDAVVYGYIMLRHAKQEHVEVPEWYSKGQLPPLEELEVTKSQAPRRDDLLHFSVLEGDASVLDECEDSLDFLKLLAELQRSCSAEEAASELPELQAARGLFRQDGDLWLSRAPGRLDVMGGISDYSGSLVLQMPIAEACHVAAQVQPPGAKLELWQHIKSRHEAAGAVDRPVLRIVSLNADNTNRGHAFDMDMADLQEEGRPLPYAKAKAFFKSDPSQSWAAYVAGALLVLMHEEGQVFQQGLSLLISSQVPDGKGVSSSAALEAASMTAISSACGIKLEPPRLAALCQLVENLVVGAPCGVMDQMAAVMGRKGCLMSLQCQPAQILPTVSIPSNLKLWGIDSGVRHSVGGQDYGSVRTAAFMGLKILTALDQKRRHSGKKLSSPDALPKERSQCTGKGYLTNIPPSEFQQFYEEKLPATMSGSQFTKEYGSHVDTATEIQEAAVYPVRQATLHPIYENFRVQSFRQALLSEDQGRASIMGELMLQSHASYTRCGLGSEATDRLVALVRAEIETGRNEGRSDVLYGAKITGGGSGGTVCILGENSPAGEAALQRVVAAYSQQTGGFKPLMLVGSSRGSAAFGCLKIRLKANAADTPASGK